MQLLSALNETVMTLWLAICAATALVALGMAAHACIMLLKRWRAGALRADIRAWARRVGDAVLLLLGI